MYHHVNHLQIAFQASNLCKWFRMAKVNNGYDIKKNISQSLNPYDRYETFYMIITKDRMAKQLSQIKSSAHTLVHESRE